MGARARVETRRRLNAERTPHNALNLVLQPDVAVEAPRDVDEIVRVAAKLAELQAAPLLNARRPWTPADGACRTQIGDSCVGVPASHPLRDASGHGMDVREHLVRVRQLEFPCARVARQSENVDRAACRIFS